MKKDFINIVDFSAEELEGILARSVELKDRKRAGKVDNLLSGKTLGMYFQKASLRTRISLEVAMNSLGGSAIYMDYNGKAMFDRESLPDQARVMARFVDIVSMRTFSHEEIEEYSSWCDKPVINALSDYSHPTQAMADIMTMRECFGDDCKGRELVYIGDGNNVARSLGVICAKLGIKFTIASPDGYHLGEKDLEMMRQACPGCEVREIVDPFEAVKNTDIIYTDVWASMGQEEEAEKRKRDFADYQLNRDLVNAAKSGVRVLHCLPAHRGDEITDEIMDDTSVSAVFDQAENRMHIYRGLITTLLGV